MNLRIAAGRRRTLARMRALLVAGLIIGLLASAGLAPAVQAASTLNVGVGVGVGAGTVSGNIYAPGAVTVLVGDSVKFTIESDEPHSVTFGNGPAGTPPDAWPVTGLTGAAPPPPATATLTGTYAGSGFLHTGLLSKGSTATIQFTAAGTLPFICVIHPGMASAVTIVASGATTTQADADAKATLTRNAILGASMASRPRRQPRFPRRSARMARACGTSSRIRSSWAVPAPEPLQAATSRPMAISRGSRGWDTAAL